MIPSESTIATSKALLEAIASMKCGSDVLSAEVNLGDAVVTVSPERLKSFMQILRDDAQLQFCVLLSVTAVDWMDERDERFEVVYHLLSLARKARLRVKCAVSEDKPQVASLCDLWPAADFMERECWDMYGIEFDGHPNLRRILMYDEFEGFPLRKDYPVQAKQPRIPLRSPEVRNTAVDMQRASLVQIGPRKKSSEQGREAR